MVHNSAESKMLIYISYERVESRTPTSVLRLGSSSHERSRTLMNVRNARPGDWQLGEGFDFHSCCNKHELGNGGTELPLRPLVSLLKWMHAVVSGLERFTGLLMGQLLPLRSAQSLFAATQHDNIHDQSTMKLAVVSIDCYGKSQIHQCVFQLNLC